jgi:lysine 2,3-aminomutase
VKLKEVKFPHVHYIFKPRHFRETALWSSIRDDQWNDHSWQLANSIRDVAQLAKIICLSEHQQKTIELTLRELKNRGQNPMSITPYYASLMRHKDFIHSLKRNITNGMKH